MRVQLCYIVVMPNLCRTTLLPVHNIIVFYIMLFLKKVFLAPNVMHEIWKQKKIPFFDLKANRYRNAKIALICHLLAKI